MQQLHNKKAFITGGSSGIGQAIAQAYAREGADIAFSYHHNERGAETTLSLIESHGRKGCAVQANLADIQSVYRLVQEAIQYLGTIDIFVNNAGTVSRHDSFLDIPIEQLDEIYAVNLKAPFILTQEIAKHMQQNNTNGSIINISSISADVITPGLTHYECSKAALNALTRGAASHLARYRIRVNAIAPGLVATNINQSQRENDPEVWQEKSSKIPLGRVGTSEDIANMAIFLASASASWMTGTIIDFDGGFKVGSPFSKVNDPHAN